MVLQRCEISCLDLDLICTAVIYYNIYNLWSPTDHPQYLHYLVVYLYGPLLSNDLLKFLNIVGIDKLTTLCFFLKKMRKMWSYKLVIYIKYLLTNNFRLNYFEQNYYIVFMLRPTNFLSGCKIFLNAL